MKETHLRSFIKGMTWRIIGTADTILLSYIFTGNIGTALKIGFIELFTKILLYYFHERIWMKYHIGQHILIEKSDSIEIENVIIYKEKEIIKH